MYICQLLAWRFLRGASYEKNISFMIKVCFFSIFISTMALTIIASIMNGFEKATHKKLQNIHSDIIIYSHNKAIDFDKLNNYLHKNFKHIIKAASPSSIKEVIIQNLDSSKKENALVALKAIDPKREFQVSALKDMLIDIDKTKALDELFSDNTLIIGARLATILNINIGDTINLLIPADTQVQQNKISLDSYNATVSGIFKTGIEEIDEHTAYSSFELFKELFEPDITQVNIKLTNNISEESALKKLKSTIPLPTHSWKELYPALVSALTLEKYVMIIILSLITLIASMNIISLLFMYITQKQGDIAILKAMGMSNNTVLCIFILLGVEISGVAAFVGMFIGSILSLLLDKYPFIKLPDAYYVTYLPAKLDIALTLKLFLLVLIISFFASWFSIKKIKHINISTLLKGL